MKNNFTFEWIRKVMESKNRLIELKASKIAIECPEHRTMERIRINNLSDSEVLKELRCLKYNQK